MHKVDSVLEQGRLQTTNLITKAPFVNDDELKVYILALNSLADNGYILIENCESCSKYLLESLKDLQKCYDTDPAKHLHKAKKFTQGMVAAVRSQIKILTDIQGNKNLKDQIFLGKKRSIETGEYILSKKYTPQDLIINTHAVIFSSKTLENTGNSTPVIFHAESNPQTANNSPVNATRDIRLVANLHAGSSRMFQQVGALIFGAAGIINAATAITEAFGALFQSSASARPVTGTGTPFTNAPQPQNPFSSLGNNNTGTPLERLQRLRNAIQDGIQNSQNRRSSTVASSSPTTNPVAPTQVQENPYTVNSTTLSVASVSSGFFGRLNPTSQNSRIADAREVEAMINRNNEILHAARQEISNIRDRTRSLIRSLIEDSLNIPRSNQFVPPDTITTVLEKLKKDCDQLDEIKVRIYRVYSMETSSVLNEIYILRSRIMDFRGQLLLTYPHT